MEILNLLDSNLIIAQMVCFFLVLVVLKQFLWKPAFLALEERKNKVEADVKAIENAKAEALRLKEEYAVLLGKIDDLSSQRIKEAVTLGEQKSLEIREKARQEAERMVEDARREIQFEFVKSRDTLKTEMVEIIIQTTEKMLHEKLDFNNDKKIVEGLLAEMKTKS